jgi:subtilisin
MRTQINLIKNKGVLYLTSLGLLIAMVLSLFTPGIALAEPPNPTALTDSYIIVFKDVVNSQAAAPEIAQAYGLQTGYIYEHALKGMSAVVPLGRLAALQKDPRVAYVVEDMVRGISAQTVPTGIQRIFADTNANIDIDGADDYRVDVDVAVIDTGIDLDHPDLNVVSSTSCLNSSGGGPPWSRTYYCGAGGDDDHYHGTHVAGTIAALDNGFGVVGVAPGARLWAVKVCDAQGSCPSSAIIAGIDYVVLNAAEIEVANMSLGGSGFNQAEYDAIQKAVNAGVAFAVAAGNSDADANNYSPAAFNNVLTVSALADFDGEPGGLGSPTCRTDQDDTLADFSNWGSAVDIAAPGVCIYSTFPIEQGEYGTISGTSMASPHAAGALALLASTNNPGNATDVHNLYNQVKNAGNHNWTDDSGDGIKEPLLDVSTFKPKLLSTGGSTNNPPSANFTFTTNELTATFTDTSSDSDGNITSWAWNFGDGATSSTQNPSHTYAADGTYTVSLTVTDDDSATGSTSKSITVTAQQNQTPTASFTYSTSGLTASFTDTSTDSDGSVVGWSWTFGDGATSTTQHPSHTYTVGGTYQVSLTVTDDDGATGSTSKSVTVSESTTTITVTSLTGSSTSIRNLWYATVTITIDPIVSGAVVSGNWSTGGTGTCTTDTTGQCSIQSGNLAKNVSSTTFTLTGVVLTGYDYLKPAVTTLTIYKP